MNFCILIELSKKKISFLYNRSDGESKFASFTGEGSALPLAIYCFGNDIQIGQFAIEEAMHQSPHAYTDVFQTMKTVGMYKYKGNEYHYNTLLKNAIEKYLTHFFDSVLIGQYGRLEQNIASMPLCFVFNSDIDENERLFVKDCFVKGGYSNLATIDYDQIVVEASSFSTNYAVCVTSDGKDLFMSLYETKTHNYMGSSIMPNRGRDPRVETAVSKLWESLGYQNYFLNQDDEIPILTKIAEDFLSSGEIEFHQNVLFSDGHTRECFLSMRELNDLKFNNDGKIVSDLKNLLQKQNISPLDCTIVLKGKAANNGYFKQIFNGEFNSMLNVNDSFHTKVLTQLLKDIKDVDYKFFTGSSIQQPEPQTKNPSGVLKREVRGKIAEIKGKIRIKNYNEAKTIAKILLDDLHNQGYFMWDVEIDSILKVIPIGETNKNNATTKQNCQNHPIPKQETNKPNSKPETKKEDVKQYQREVRTLIAEAKAKIRKGNIDSAIATLTSLKKEMNKKGIFDFDNNVDEILNTINMAAKSVSEKKIVSPPTITNLSGAERLLSSGKFQEAKRAFAAEGNSVMAQLCSELIKSKRTITLYQSSIESIKRSSNKILASTAIQELSKILKLYNAHNITSTSIEELIRNYKSIY